MKTIALLILITLNAVVLHIGPVLAGQVGDLIDFTAGTPAIADDVDQNFNDIKEAVNDNDNRITTNATAIQDKTTAIQDNATAIQSKQNRVDGTCPEGQSIRVINPDGSVECEVDNDGASGFIILSPYGSQREGDATVTDGFGPHSGLRLPDGSNSSFAHGFVLPPDYITGNPITVDLIWHTSSTSCGIALSPNSIAVARIGQTHIMGSNASTGLTAIGGAILNAPSTANQSGLKSYAITAPDGSSLQAGDSIIFSLFRAFSSPNDTCAGDLIIQGISVTY
jgi:hypothetical protein